MENKASLNKIKLCVFKNFVSFNFFSIEFPVKIWWDKMNDFRFRILEKLDISIFSVSIDYDKFFIGVPYFRLQLSPLKTKNGVCCR